MAILLAKNSRLVLLKFFGVDGNSWMPEGAYVGILVVAFRFSLSVNPPLMLFMKDPWVRGKKVVCLFTYLGGTIMLFCDINYLAFTGELLEGITGYEFYPTTLIGASSATLNFACMYECCSKAFGIAFN